MSATLCLENQGRIWQLADRCRNRGGVLELVPGMNSLCITLTQQQDPEAWCQWLSQEFTKVPAIVPEGKVYKIPVSYGGEHGPDLADVAAFHEVSPADIIRAHTEADYRVFFLGFLPGFAYLGGLPLSLHTPRLATPRQQVPAGSVGIGGSQTGIYPCEAPGGWRLIGRTGISLFNPLSDSPCLLAPGDRVQFVVGTPDD